MLSDSSLRALLEARVARGTNAGIVAVQITPQGRAVAVAGVAGSPDGKPLSPSTLFEIGSITKVVTGTLFAEAIRRGEVRENERLADALPGIKLPAGGDSITLLDLATHRSGLPEFPAGHVSASSRDPWADVDEAAVAKGFAIAPVRFAPGSKAEYNNVGAGLLGRVLVQRAGVKDFDALVRQRIAAPLKLRDFGVALTSGQQARLAEGHTAAGPTAHWHLPYLPSAGAVIASLADMEVFARACLGTAPEPLASAIRVAQEPRRDFPGLKIGYHWFVMPMADSSVITWHNGMTGGFSSWMGCNRKTGRAAVVLTNSNAFVDDIGVHLVEPSRALRPPPQQPVRAAVKVTPELLDALVGRYTLTPTFVLTVTREGSWLALQGTGQGKYPLDAESDYRWTVPGVNAAVEFERNADGKVVALTLIQNGARQRAPRQ